MLHRQNDGTARWIAVIGENHIALGDPVAGGVDEEAADNTPGHLELYIPSWFVGTCGLEGAGDKVRVRFERCESFLKAEKLGFQVMGNIPTEIDVRDLLEEPLSQLGVIRKDQIIPLPLLEGVYLILKTCEPDGPPVFLDGAEISLEIEEDLPASVSTPAFGALAELVESAVAEDLPMLPAMPSAPESHPPHETVTNGRFVAFQGVGRRLCD
jgi:hypothetical protein